MPAEILKRDEGWELKIPKHVNAPVYAMEWLSNNDMEKHLQYILHDDDYFTLSLELHEKGYEEFRDYINKELIKALS